VILPPLGPCHVPTVSQDRVAQEITNRKSLSSQFRWHGLVLDFSNVSNIDSTAISVLGEIVDDMRNRSLRLCFAMLSQSVRSLRHHWLALW
jgi:anti-anti-sigma regulatory factor